MNTKFTIYHEEFDLEIAFEVLEGNDKYNHKQDFAELIEEIYDNQLHEIKLQVANILHNQDEARFSVEIEIIEFTRGLEKYLLRKRIIKDALSIEESGQLTKNVFGEILDNIGIDCEEDYNPYQDLMEQEMRYL